MNRLVEFKGTKYWFLDHGGRGALAPLHHCDENGDIANLYVAVSGVSFAHIYSDGKIMRFGEQIGTIDDLKLLG